MIESDLVVNNFNNKFSLKSPFESFWMAGYECTDKLNAFGNRVDFLKITDHINALHEDYAKLKTFNISTVREGIRWSYVEKTAYKYDFSVVEEMIKAAKVYNIQIIWDLCHFGFPDDLTPLHPMFVKRFVSLCRAFVEFYRSISPSGNLIIIPINEVSFISWLGGHVCGTTPYTKGYGWEVKYELMKAFVQGAKALKQLDSDIIISTSEPLVNMVPPINATEEELATASVQHLHQYQAVDMLCGKMCPELDGDPELLDIIGINYYYNNQWISNTEKFLVWKDNPKDERWRPLNHLIEEVYNRYHKPIVITETSHPKEDRPLWIIDITKQLVSVLSNDIPLLGVCIYPIIDRPDWDDLVTWHKAGLWDVIYENGTFERVLCEPFAEALLNAQELLKKEQRVLPRLHEMKFLN